VPPDVADGGFKVELADDEPDPRARKKASAPPPPPPEEEPKVQIRIATPGARKDPSVPVQEVKAAPAAAAAPAPAPEPRKPLGNPLANPRVRFAAGVVLSVLLGFVPAHFVASMREKSAFDEADRKVLAEQEQATTEDAYAKLDEFRDQQLSRKHSDRRSIAIMAFIIWGAAGAGIAYGWFRRIPWERFEA
jgi:hypothetical protein